MAHFDRLLTFTLSAKPSIHAEIKGSEASKQICLVSTYDVDVNAAVDLDINIPWANIAKDWHWAKDIVNTGEQPILDKCVFLESPIDVV